MVDSLYGVEGLPVLQNRLYRDPASARSCPTGDVSLVACPTTGIVTNRRFDPAKVVYDASYNNEQAASGAFRSHLDAVANLVSAHMDCSALIEIGCGKGAFLELMTGGGAGVVATGSAPVDPLRIASASSAPITLDAQAVSGSVLIRAGGTVAVSASASIKDELKMLRLHWRMRRVRAF